MDTFRYLGSVLLIESNLGNMKKEVGRLKQVTYMYVWSIWKTQTYISGEEAEH